MRVTALLPPLFAALSMCPLAGTADVWAAPAPPADSPAEAKEHGKDATAAPGKDAPVPSKDTPAEPSNGPAEPSKAAPVEPSKVAEAAPSNGTAKPKKTKDGAKKKAEEAPTPPRTSVLFAGFRANSDSSSHIWVKLNKAPKVTSEQKDGRATYRLHASKLLVRNNRYPLITEFFDSAVLSAHLMNRGTDVELQVKLRKGTPAATHRVKTFKDGSVSFQVDIPAPPPLAPGETREPPKVHQPNPKDGNKNPTDAPPEEGPEE